MKNLNKNSFAWFIGAIFFGGVAVGSGYAIEFIIFLLAIIPVGISPWLCHAGSAKEGLETVGFQDRLVVWPSSVLITILTIPTTTLSFPLNTVKLY